MTKNQKIALGLVGVAAAALLFCALTKQWFSIEYRWGATVQIGLRSTTVCNKAEGEGKQCETQSLDEVFGEARKTDDALDTWLSASRFTYFGALGSVAILLAVGVLGLLRHDKVGMVGKIGLLVIIVTIMGAVFVLAKRPPAQGLNASWGVFLFMGGGMAGVVGAYMLTNPSTYEEIERDPDIPRL